MRIDLTKMQVAAVVTHLRDMLGEEPDEQLLADSLEGETDLFEMSRKILEWIEREEGDQVALKTQMEERQMRKKRSEERTKAHRSTLMALMETAGLDKLKLPEATLSIRQVPPKPIITDEDAVPDEFCKFKKSPDMAAIRAEMDAGRVISGVATDNGGTSLTIRKA
jgi:hypothetical protein